MAGSSSAAAGGEPARAPSSVALVGNPNVGKSVLFGLLSGRYVTVSNYPGTTVEVSHGVMTIEGRRVAVIDTPGVNGLVPQSEDERVTRDLLLESPGATVLQVADAKNLTRALALTLQIAEAGLPSVLCLNMSDEAESLGVRIDAERLSRLLGIDVVCTVATRRKGISRLPSLLAFARVGSRRVEYGAVLEEALSRIERVMPRGAVSARALAVAALSGDQTLGAWFRQAMPASDLAELEDALRAASREIGTSPAYGLQQRRVAAAEDLARRVVVEGGSGATARAAWSDLTMHRVWGIPIVATVLYAIYLFVGVLGAQIGVGWVEEGLFEGWINPAARAFLDRWSGSSLLTEVLVGPYGLITMGLTYAIAIVLPIVVTFFFAFSVLEDSGYLPRLAVMLNRIFRIMGLNGRAVLPMVLGLGCDTMATLTTRVLATRKERLLVILLLALGVPCSAQLGVVLGLLAGLSWKATAVWAGVTAGVLLVVGYVAAVVIPGERSSFIMEVPPLRVPSPGNLIRKTLARVEWYLKEAVPLFLLGTLILFVADRTAVLGIVEKAARPVVTTMLGLPAAASQAFVLGFLRRDFGAAGLYRLAEGGGLDAVQIVVSLVTMTLFIPCIANFFMIIKEQGTRVAFLVAGVVFPLAVLVGAALRLALRLLGADLT